MISVGTQVHWIEWPCLALRCIICHGKVWHNPNLASLHIFCQVTWKDTFHSFDPFNNRNNIIKLSTIFTDLAGLSNFTKRVSSTSFPWTPLWDVQPAIKPSWPLVMHNTVAALFLIITGIPIQEGVFQESGQLLHEEDSIWDLAAKG